MLDALGGSTAIDDDGDVGELAVAAETLEGPRVLWRAVTAAGVGVAGRPCSEPHLQSDVTQRAPQQEHDDRGDVANPSGSQ